MTPRWHFLTTLCLLIQVPDGGSGHAQQHRPAWVEHSQQIWHSLELNPGLITYDQVGAESLIVTKNGSLLIFVEATKCNAGFLGCEDNNGRHDILVKRSDNNGASFGNATLVHSESNATASVVIGNAAAVLDQHTGRIYIFMCRNNTEVLLSHSDDNGQSWAAPRDVTAMVKRPTWGWYATTFSAIQLKHQATSAKNGRLIVCCDHQDHNDNKNNGNETYSHSHLIYSDDGGSTWHIGAIADDLTNECAIAELYNGTIVMNARDYVGQASQTAHRSISWSEDGGETLSPGYLTPSLPDPICEGAMATDGAAEMLVFSHPANPRNRDHMTVLSSMDGGASWAPAVLLDANYSSYSSLALLPNGSFAVSYNTGTTRMHRCSTPPQLPSGAYVGCGVQFATITFGT